MADCYIKLLNGSEIDCIGSESPDDFDILEDLPIASSADILAYMCAENSIECLENKYEVSIIPPLFLFYKGMISVTDLLEKISTIYHDNGCQSRILSEIIDGLESIARNHENRNESETDDDDNPDGIEINHEYENDNDESEDILTEDVMTMIAEKIGTDVFEDIADEIDVDTAPIPASEILYLVINYEYYDYTFGKDYYFEDEVYKEFESDSKTSPNTIHFKYLLAKWSVFLSDLLEPNLLEISLHKDTVKDALCSGKIRELLPYGIGEFRDNIIYINHKIPEKPKIYQFPKGEEEIGRSFEEQFSNLEKVIIPDSAIIILSNTFENSKLESVDIPYAVTEIGDKAFFKSRKLKCVHLPKNLKKIGVKAFDGCSPKLILDIPERVTEIGFTERKDLLVYASGHKIRISPFLTESNISNEYYSIHYSCYYSYKVLEKFIKSSDAEMVRLLIDVLDIPGDFSNFWHIGIMREAIKSSSAEITAILLNSGALHLTDEEFEYLISFSSENGRVEQTSLLLNRKNDLFPKPEPEAESFEIFPAVFDEKESENSEIIKDYEEEFENQTVTNLYKNMPDSKDIIEDIPNSDRSASETENKNNIESTTDSQKAGNEPYSETESENSAADGDYFTDSEEQKSIAIVEKREIADPDLSAKIERTFEKLEQYYPEHKVFALDNIDSILRAKITDLYKEAGYKSDNEMLQAYGFEFISGEEVRKIRSTVQFTPGNEPALIKPKVDSMLRRLEEYYPDHVIPDTLARNHKKLSGSVSGLYQWLGYADAVTMLKAYGFTYYVKPSGRVASNNYENIIQILIEKYREGPKPKNISAIISDNPEYKAQLKTLQNNQYKILGVSIRDYFKEVGILSDTGATPEKSRNKNEKHISSVLCEGETESINESQKEKKQIINPEESPESFEEPRRLPGPEEGDVVKSNVLEQITNDPEPKREILSLREQRENWIRYQANEVMTGGYASAYYFFDLRNEITLGNNNLQSDEFLSFYIKYFPGLSIDQLNILRTQAISRLNEPNTCNSQYQIIMRDSFEHRYIMIAHAWFDRAVNCELSIRASFVFNACFTFFYPQEQQELWNRLCHEAAISNEKFHQP